MRDDPTLVEQIQRDLQDVRWLGPEEIRSRARRRSQRKIVVATVVLALAGASAVAVAAPRTSPPPAPPAASASPTRHEITTDALLQPADLSQQVDVQLSQSGLGEPVLLNHMLGYCRTRQGRSEGWQMSILSRSQTFVPKHAAPIHTRSAGLVTQDLFRLVPEAARQLFASLDDLVAPCAEWLNVGPVLTAKGARTGEALHRWSVTQRGFAGDDAAILRDSLTVTLDLETGQPLGDPPSPILLAVVRVGDTVSVLSLGYDGTEAELVRLASAAAARMCAAANPPC
ncbi:hypothetical protein [Micromonospora ureilytica]|uniref:Uncharacterized protein n=1 Tax=Micromonospora ureilytica TaxID=709868 RepID=A0ABS0JM96_9ACTN|nr:hypothetical protein [Micromonospora ureilytica]MBG6067935.1 hypothetical protein [Micromonospora ureilytica]WSR58615.1 hypothetical protein OG400_10700 [Micromonospora ureilytica]